jgi:hypothetical protein
LNGDELSFSAPAESGLPDGTIVYLKRMSEKVENLIGLKMTVNFGDGDSEYDIN